MIPITLHDSNRQQLEHTFKTTADRRLRDRCQALWLANRGRRHHQSADDLGVTPRPLQRWRNASRTRGFAGRRRPWAPGRAPRLPETLASARGAWVQQGPGGCGRDRAHWTAAARATSLYQTKGLAGSERPRRAFCPTHAVRPARPTEPSLNGDPDQQEAARQALETLKTSPRR